jgi:hypothetical protein
VQLLERLERDVPPVPPRERLRDARALQVVAVGDDPLGMGAPREGIVDAKEQR